MSTAQDDLERLKTEYKYRQLRLKNSNKYSSLDTSYLFTIQQRQRATINLLQNLNIHSLAQKRILEVGCGQGDILHELLFHRIQSKELHGAELLPDRLAIAKQRLPGIKYVVADARNLPYADCEFDLVLQYTMFSSILESGLKADIARSMLRVVKNPGGLILWYDFWWNPYNRQTKGIRKSEIKRLFPNCNLVFRRITLAPPISRKVIPLSWTICVLLEKLTILNTHYLVAIQPA